MHSEDRKKDLKMAAKKKSKSKSEKPPAIDKLLKPAIGVVIAFVGYYFMKGLDAEVGAFQFIKRFLIQIIEYACKNVVSISAVYSTFFSFTP